MRLRLLVITAAYLAFALGAPAHAADGVHVAAKVNGTSVGAGEVELAAGEPVQVALTVTNRGDAAVTVAEVRLAGSALGVPLFAVTTAVAMEVQPGRAVEHKLALEVAQLHRHATGAVRFELSVWDATGRLLAERTGQADVGGAPIGSLWGMYCLTALLLTLVSVGQLGVAAHRRRLPRDRRRCTAMFAVVGAVTGVGLVALASLTGLLAPSLWLAVPLVGALTAGGVLAGRSLCTDDAPAPVDQVSHT